MELRDVTPKGAPMTSSDSAAQRSPQRPEALRAQPPRPQSTRFLRETLVKLSEDSARIGQRLVGVCESDHNSVNPTLRKNPPWVLPEQANYLAPWEASFRRPPSPSTIHEPFVAAKDYDPDIAPQDPEATRPGSGITCTPYNARDAMLAVANVISSWEQSTSKAAERWARHIDQQTEVHNFSNERWDAVRGQLSSIAEHLDRIERQVADRTAGSQAFEAEQRGANERLEALVRCLAQDCGEAARNATDQVLGTLRHVEEHALATQTHAESLIHGPASGDVAENGESAPQATRVPIGQQLQEAREQLSALTALAKEDVASWRETADRWHKEREDAFAAADTARATTASVEREVERLRGEADGLRAELAEVQQQLEAMKKAPAAACLERVQAMEQRGRVKLDRTSGQVSILSGLAFVPANPSEPPQAVFKDAAAADEVIADLAALWLLFEGPIDIDLRIKPGKGGNQEFWNAAAAAQASCLRDALGAAGVPQLMISAKGAQVDKGADASMAIVFKRDVFTWTPPVAAQTDKKDKKPTPRSAK